ncbi:MAG: helical backbone metal receptor [candidate division WOR-3 bacterium]
MKYFSDFLGRYVEIPDKPKRIVSLAPDITETLFRLGVGDRVVGISLYCSRPKDRLNGIPRVGAYLNVLWDKLERLNPDLVFLTTGAQRNVAEGMLNRGFPVVVLSVPNSVFGIFENIRKVGLAVDEVKRADELVFYLMGKLWELYSHKVFVRVYYEVDLGGSITAGGPSYITQALRFLGLENIYSHKRDSYFKPDDKETKSLGFDLILFEPKPERKYTEEKIKEGLKERFGNVPILILEPDSLAHYGPALIDEVLPKLCKKLEKFSQK